MFIEAPELSAHAGMRHAFFTRVGGVSEGLYASLNGGLGSQDAPERVAENRARMCARLGLPPARTAVISASERTMAAVARSRALLILGPP